MTMGAVMTMMTMITMLTMKPMMTLMIMRKDNDDNADFTDDRCARLHTLSLNSCTGLANQATREAHYCAAANYRDYHDDND